MDKKAALKELAEIKERTRVLEKIIEDDDIPSLMKKVKNYSDLCKVKGFTELTESDFMFLSPEKRKKAVLFDKLQNINQVFGFKPDWKNRNQSKWRPWFERQASGWVFSFSCCGICASLAAVGFYETEEISNHVGKTFLKEHTEFLEIQ